MGPFEGLKERGLIAQTTNEEKVQRAVLNGTERVIFYIGFDPTADSLHVGHFVQVMVMAHMQRARTYPDRVCSAAEPAWSGIPSGKE